MLSSTNKKTRIYIKRKPSIFRSLQFSSEFPKKLNGIINPEEFYQSIANINQAYRKTFWEILLVSVCPLFIIASIILWSLLAVKTIRDNAFIPVIVVASVLQVIGSFSCICIQICINRSRGIRVRNVLADESMKYSMTLMLPFTWQLERQYVPPTHYEDSGTIIEKLVIEIGQSTDSEMRNNALNFNSAEPTAYIGQQYPMFPSSHPSAINSSFLKSYP